MENKNEKKACFAVSLLYAALELKKELRSIMHTCANIHTVNKNNLDFVFTKNTTQLKCVIIE